MQLRSSHTKRASGVMAPQVIHPIGLPVDLRVPEGAVGVVLFAHGSGSSRLSPRNTYVASALRQERIGTMLFDLLTPAEEADRSNVFDTDLLASRLAIATRWLRCQIDNPALPIGYFGASTGAGAALVAAANLESEIAAIVSRGGRPDLARSELRAVRAPTLLIVGEDDPIVIEVNRAALAQMTCRKKLVIVPGASHLFEEPGTLDVVVDLACHWFLECFSEYRHPTIIQPASRPALNA